LKFEVIVADTTNCCLMLRNDKYIGREVAAFRRNLPKNIVLLWSTSTKSFENVWIYQRIRS